MCSRGGSGGRAQRPAQGCVGAESGSLSYHRPGMPARAQYTVHNRQNTAKLTSSGISNIKCDVIFVMLNEYRRCLIFEHTYLSLRAARWWLVQWWEPGCGGDGRQSDVMWLVILDHLKYIPAPR